MTIPIQTLLSRLTVMWATWFAHCSWSAPGIPFPCPWGFALSPPGVSCSFLSVFQVIQVPGFYNISPVHLSLRLSFLSLGIHWTSTMSRVMFRPWEPISKAQCFRSRAYRLVGDPPKANITMGMIAEHDTSETGPSQSKALSEGTYICHYWDKLTLSFLVLLGNLMGE